MLISGLGTVGGYGTIAMMSPRMLLTFYHEVVDQSPDAWCNSFNFKRRMR
jgi:hypothetical protein